MNEDTCIICLSSNMRIFNITNTHLHTVYEKITDIKLNSRKIHTLCFICFTKLKQCYKLIQEADSANKFLKQLFKSSVKIETPTEPCFPLLTLSSVQVYHMSIDIGIEEQQTLIDKDVKEEEIDGTEDFVNRSIKESDSEDDLPLQQISIRKDIKSEVVVNSKSETEKDSQEEVRVRGKKRERRRKSSELIDARLVTLSSEEQLKEMQQRATSLNYLNSPYKCGLCYKGFINPYAYEKHNEKHDKTSGEFECTICRLRYSSSRQLRAHNMSAHERRFDCNLCSHRSHTRNQAKDHERWHKGHTYPCQLCGVKFSKPTSYLTHLRKLHSSEHVCRRCGESFVGRHGLMLHLSKSHKRDQQDSENQSEPAESRFCSECKIQFVTVDAWKRHVLTSSKHAAWSDNSPTCKICGVKVSPLTHRAHMKLHSQSLRPKFKDGLEKAPALAKLTCDQCDSSFTSKSRLQAHVKRVHLGLKYNKNIVCEICGKKCTSNATLRYHQRRHTGERPYACACGARFADSNQLRIHARVHSGERPYSCALCGKTFSQKPALNKHFRVHTGAKPYGCHMCNKSFSQSNSLKLHVRTVHLKLPPNNKKKAVKEKTDD